MKVMNTAAVVVAAAALSAVGFVMPAQASTLAVPAADDASFTTMATAPSCVKLKQGRDGSTAWAEAKNECGRTVRFRMIWAWAGDGSCVSKANGTTHRETRGAANIPPRPYVDELRAC